jgi:putative hydrolase of the HAD superfamily
VVTSVKCGWRKPHKIIYDEAVSKSGAKIRDICFIGDDYVCDYKAPREIGIKSYLYDRNMKYSHIQDRVTRLIDLKQLL